MKGLTKRQSEVAAYIEEFIANHRYSPSYREIGKRFNFKSLGSVYKHVQALKRKGILDFEGKSSRSIQLAKTTNPKDKIQEISIPFIGSIAQGKPVKLFSKTKEICVPRFLTPNPERTYALSLQGDFLAEEMIADGDLILIEAREYAFTGETVLALVNGEFTLVKKYYAEEERVRLLSTHAQHSPILLHRDDLLIHGIVVGLLRQY